MVARRTLLLLCILLIVATWQTTPIGAASSPPDWLSPRPIDSCVKENNEPDSCFDGNILALDLSVDGEVAIFESDGNRFVAADSNRVSDIFVWQAGSVQRGSVGANGEQADHVSDRAALSGNGLYLYFRSQAGNLVAGTVRGRINLYIKELATGRLALISRNVEGAPINVETPNDHFAHIDTDFSGRYVVFASAYANFVEGVIDINQAQDIFLADVDPDGNGDYFDSAPQLYLLSALADGTTTGNGASFEPTISQDGSALAWLTRATDLAPGTESNGAVVDVLLARLGRLPDGSIDPSTRTLIAINRMGDDAETLSPQGARLARIDPWRDQVAFVTADDIPGTGDDHAGQDVYLSVGSTDDANQRQMVWMSHAYTSSQPNALSIAWDPLLPAATLSQVAWVAQNSPRTVDDLLLQRAAPFYPTGWSTVNWVEAATPSSETVTNGVMSADGRFALWTTIESYGLDVPSGSINLFRREIAPAQSVPLTVNTATQACFAVGSAGTWLPTAKVACNTVGGEVTYAPAGLLLDGTMHYSPTTLVTLMPKADVGYRFREWVGVDSRNGMTATVIVYGARTVTVSFDAMTPPTVSNVTLVVAEDAPLQAIPLTISDPDPDESHTVSIAQTPSHGVAAVVTNVIQYQPAPNFNGQDTFTVQVTDAYGLQLAQAALVTVLVTPVGDAPVTNDLTLTVAEDTLLPNIALTISDPDINDIHTLTLADTPNHGTATLLNNTASYQPALNFNGQDHFMLQVTDGAGLQLAAPALVTVNVTPVNDAPTADDLTLIVAEDTLFSGITLAIADPDIGDTHSVSLANAPSHGTATLLNNVVSYQPASNFNGEDDFTLQVTDGSGAQLAIPATVTVQVTPVNDPPIAASAHGDGVNNGAAIPVWVSVQDPDPVDSHTLAVETPPAAGSVRIGTQPQAQGYFEYTPMANFAGVDTFTFRATDNGNASIVGTATVTVTLAPSGPPPTNYLLLPTLRRSP